MTGIKLPFEPNEKVKKAFNRSLAMKQTVETIIETLITAAENTESGWEIAIKEHPELPGHKKVKYNHLTQQIELVE